MQNIRILKPAYVTESGKDSTENKRNIIIILGIYIALIFLAIQSRIHNHIIARFSALS